MRGRVDLRLRAPGRDAGRRRRGPHFPRPRLRAADADQHRLAARLRPGHTVLAMSRAWPRGACAGHTLVELMVVLALAAILCSLAIPALQSLLAQLQLRGAVGDLRGAIDLARSQALGSGNPVTLAPLEPAGLDWRLGWVVFADANRNRRPDAGETVFFRHRALPDGITVSTVFSSGTPPDYLAYNGAGRGCDAANSQA